MTHFNPKQFRLAHLTQTYTASHFSQTNSGHVQVWQNSGRYFAVLLIALLACTACWRSSDPPPTPKPTSTAPPTTPTPFPLAGVQTLWHSWSEGDATALEQILGSAAQQYPALQIESVFVPYNDLAQRYAEAVRADGGPDLVLMPNWWLGDLASEGVIAPIDPLVAPELLAPYWPETVENLRRGGQLFGVPIYLETISLYYNRRLIDDSMLPGSTADLLALPQQDPSFGIGLYNNLYFLYWGIPAYGGQLLDQSGTITLDQNEGAATFLAWLAQINQTYGSFVDTDYGRLMERFKKGEFAFFVDGPWSIPELHAAHGDDLGVMLLPAGTVGPARPWMSTEGFLFNPATTPEQREVSVQLALYLTNVTHSSTMAQVARRLPANRWASVTGDPLLGGFWRQAATAEAMPNAPEMAEVWGYGGDMLLKVIDGAADPRSVVFETTALINEANLK